MLSQSTCWSFVKNFYIYSHKSFSFHYYLCLVVLSDNAGLREWVGKYCCSVTKSCPTLCDLMNCYVACQASLSLTISWSLLKLMFIESVMPSNHLILCCPLFLLPSIFPSIRVFSSELALHIRWPKFWSFSISPSNEYSGLISFTINWFDLLAVQGTLKSLLQHPTISKYESFGSQPSLWSNSPICTWLLEKI